MPYQIQGFSIGSRKDASMNLRPALRAFVDSSNSSIQSPVGLIAKRSISLVQSSSPQISKPHSCDPSSLSSLDSSHLSKLYSPSLFYTRRSRFGKFARSSVFTLTSNSDSRFGFKASSLSTVSGNFSRIAFSVSSMSLSSEPSLHSLSLQTPDPVADTVQAGTDVSKAEDEPVKEDVVVQYIVIRKDLVVEQSWPLGSIISQGCHAAVAAIWISKDDPVTALYCLPENLDHMHKVVLEVKGETQLRNLSQKLVTAGVAHKLWVEQPENYATCLATKPYHRSQVAAHFKKLKLCK